jgi:hypothetical protein
MNKVSIKPSPGATFDSVNHLDSSILPRIEKSGLLSMALLCPEILLGL